MLELVSRGRSIKRRLPSRFGGAPFYASADAQLKYLKPGEGAYDDELFKIIQEHIREDSIVWDIGANVGLFALCAAGVAKRGSVLAVEPDIWLAQLIGKSMRLKANGRLNLQVLPCAIADRNGVAKFMISSRGRASNALEAAGGRSQIGGIREVVRVPTLALDTLLDFFGSPSFVKIDIEGAEAMALRGACRLLSESRPTIYIEVGAEASEEVSSIFHQAGYKLYDGALPMSQQKPKDFCAYNTLAKPQESIKFKL
jgi:FkbM family methyltransferase